VKLGLLLTWLTIVTVIKAKEEIEFLMDLNLANDSTCSEFLATDLYIALKCSDEFRVYSISPDNYLQLQHETTN
jgi:hypothetical protein